VEHELRELKTTLANGNRSGWEAILGSNANDPTFAAFLQEMQRQRRADDRRAASPV
jgi:hypothetical protein